MDEARSTADDAVMLLLMAAGETTSLSSVIAPVAVSVTTPGAVTLFRIKSPPVVTVTSLPLPAAKAVNVIAPTPFLWRNTPPAVAVAVSVVTGISIK